MITYKAATADDAKPIAQLHSLSWQQNYRGILRDEFLNGPVLEDRQIAWENRLKQPAPNQYVAVATLHDKIVGFACVYTNEDPIWGTLLDNLHVHPNQKGQGVGSALIRLAAGWTYRTAPESGFYLWVVAQNTSAQLFYDRLGGINQETASHEFPDGSVTDCYRYVWTDIQVLL